MAWMRLESTFRSHPKILRLARILGVRRAEARGLIAGLWTYAVEQAPDGDLSGLDDAGIEEAADWEGEPGAFLAAAKDLGLIDVSQAGAEIHDWMRYAGSFREAHKKAKQRAQKRMSPKCPLIVPEMSPPTRRRRDEDGTIGSEDTATSLLKSTPTLPGIDQSPEGAPPRSRAAAVEAVFARYLVHHPGAKLGKKERALIEARLKAPETWPIDQLCAAIDGYHSDPWHRGENDRGRPYLDLTLIMRDASHVQRGIDFATEPRRKPIPRNETAGERQIREGLASVERALEKERLEELRLANGNGVRQIERPR